MSDAYLIINAGSGEEEEEHLAEAGAASGFEVIAFRPEEDDLAAIAAKLARRRPRALAIAGGDGSQGPVAAACAAHQVAYVCVPAGTRNHFALDLGLDRGDPAAALAALERGRERRVDLGCVNGRAFVNNVSLGLYAEAVGRGEYRSSKLRALARTALAALRPGAAERPHLRWRDGGEERDSAMLLVSNNVYRFAAGIGSGHRERLDAATLGMVELRAPGGRGSGPPLRQWESARFEVRSDQPVQAAIDGEAAALEPPLEFEVRPGALRVLLPD